MSNIYKDLLEIASGNSAIAAERMDKFHQYVNRLSENAQRVRAGKSSVEGTSADSKAPAVQESKP